MKKMSKGIIIALLAGVVMVQGLSAYDFNWGAWGRASWSPLALQGGPDATTADPVDTKIHAGAGSGPAWDSLGAAIGFEANAANANNNVGFQLKLRVNSGNGSPYWYPNDNTANAWVKPFGDILTIRVGMYQVDDLRGKLGGANENFVVGSAVEDEDRIFTRFKTGNMGAHFKIVPIENLQIHASLGVNTKFTGDLWKYPSGLGDIYSTGQYGIGYTIPDIGFARFQFIGGRYSKDVDTYFTADNEKTTREKSIFPNQTADWNQLQLAFQLAAVENLDLDFGLIVPLAINIVEKEGYDGGKGPVPYTALGHTLITTDDSYQAPITVGLAAKYTMGDLDLFFRTDVGFLEKATYKLDKKYEAAGQLSLGFLIEPSYQIGDLGRVFGDIGLKVKGNGEDNGVDKKDGTMDLGLGASFHRNLGGGGNFTIGVASAIPLGGDGYADDKNAVKKAQALKVVVPMTITYSLY